MFLLAKAQKKVSARTQIDINGVSDGVLLLPGNHYRAILQVSPLNFELRSEAEQDALIETYESFLNSLGRPLQILIRTREIDLDKYLSELDERLSGELEVIYQTQLKNYGDFIRSLVTTNKILTRHFYVILTYDAAGKVDFDIAKEQLNLSVDIIAKGLSRLGMGSRELSSLEVLDLFYSFYNPSQAKRQPLSDQLLSLLHSTYITKEPADA